jgi:hypothetical protein
MDEKLIRIYKSVDLRHMKKQLMIYGDTSGVCGHCDKMDLKLEMDRCPECQTAFSFISFRNVKTHLPKILKLIEHRPNLLIVDFEDYRQGLGAVKALDFLK